MSRQKCIISLHTRLCLRQALKTDTFLSLHMVILTFIQNEQLLRDAYSFHIQSLTTCHVSTSAAVGFMWSLDAYLQFLMYPVFTLEFTWVDMYHPNSPWGFQRKGQSHIHSCTPCIRNRLGKSRGLINMFWTNVCFGIFCCASV